MVRWSRLVGHQSLCPIRVRVTSDCAAFAPPAGRTRDDGRICTRECVVDGHRRTSAGDCERAGDQDRTGVLSLGKNSVAAATGERWRTTSAGRLRCAAVGDKGGRRRPRDARGIESGCWATPPTMSRATGALSSAEQHDPSERRVHEIVQLQTGLTRVARTVGVWS